LPPEPLFLFFLFVFFFFLLVSRKTYNADAVSAASFAGGAGEPPCGETGK
jgi:hypothetical protein